MVAVGAVERVVSLLVLHWFASVKKAVRGARVLRVVLSVTRYNKRKCATVDTIADRRLVMVEGSQ